MVGFVREILRLRLRMTMGRETVRVGWACAAGGQHRLGVRMLFRHVDVHIGEPGAQVAIGYD